MIRHILEASVMCLLVAACSRHEPADMSRSRSLTGPTGPTVADAAAAADGQPGTIDITNAAGRVAELVQRTTPSNGSRVIHIAKGMSASSPAASATLEGFAKDLYAALVTSLQSRGFTVSRNLAPPVPPGGDLAPVLQPEKLDPTPGWVLYVAVSNAASPAGRATVTYWMLTYEDYAKTGVFKSAGTRESLLVTISK